MRLSLRVICLITLTCIFPTVATKAQTPGPGPRPTTANIGYLSPTAYVNNLFSGTDAFINTRTFPNTGIAHHITNSTNENGRTGNAIIVTPISDPVIFFDSISIVNTSGSPIRSITLRLPQIADDPSDPLYAFRRQLGFINDGYARGTDADGDNFFINYLDPVDLSMGYNGDYLPYTNVQLYSTLRFYKGPLGAAEINDLSSGTFSFTAAFPNTEGTQSFVTDTVPRFSEQSTANETDFLFNTSSNRRGGIRLSTVTPEVPGMVQLLVGLLPVAYVLKRQRRK